MAGAISARWLPPAAHRPALGRCDGPGLRAGRPCPTPLRDAAPLRRRLTPPTARPPACETGTTPSCMGRAPSGRDSGLGAMANTAVLRGFVTHPYRMYFGCASRQGRALRTRFSPVPCGLRPANAALPAGFITRRAISTRTTNPRCTAASSATADPDSGQRDGTRNPRTQLALEMHIWKTLTT